MFITNGKTQLARIVTDMIGVEAVDKPMVMAYAIAIATVKSQSQYPTSPISDAGIFYIEKNKMAHENTIYELNEYCLFIKDLAVQSTRAFWLYQNNCLNSADTGLFPGASFFDSYTQVNRYFSAKDIVFLNQNSSAILRTANALITLFKK